MDEFCNVRFSSSLVFPLLPVLFVPVNSLDIIAQVTHPVITLARGRACCKIAGPVPELGQFSRWSAVSGTIGSKAAAVVGAKVR